MGFPNSVFGGGGGGTGGGGGATVITIVEGVIDLTPNPTSLYLLDESNLLALTEMTPKYENVYSIDLDGGAWATADKLQVATQPAFDFDYTDAFSLSAWFKTSTITWQGIIEKVSTWIPGDWANIRGWGINWIDGRPQFWLNNTYSANGVQAKPTTGNWADGNWHHVVVTTAGTAGTLTTADMTIWVDNFSQTLGVHATNSLSASITGTYDVRIGQVFGGYGSGWNGSLDEISVWNKALSPSEIAEIYNSGSPPDLDDHSATANLVSWWRMGDGADGAVPDSSNSADPSARIYDMSSNSFNMTPVNTVTGDIQADVP